MHAVFGRPAGRGLKTWNHCGNESLRKLVRAELPCYGRAWTRVEKSAILCDIMRHFRIKSPEAGGFVKQDLKTKRWHIVEDLSARAFVAQAFRDALSNKYRSSKQCKRERRWNQKIETGEPGLKGSIPILPKDDTQPEVSMPTIAPSSSMAHHQPTPMKSVQGVLDGALYIADGNHFHQEDTMSALLTNFFGNREAPWAGNPFEPTPISPQHPLQQSLMAQTTCNTFAKSTSEMGPCLCKTKTLSTSGAWH